MTQKLTFIARPLHLKLHFLHLYTVKDVKKMQVKVLKIID